jgi:hypothetical protein
VIKRILEEKFKKDTPRKTYTFTKIIDAEYWSNISFFSFQFAVVSTDILTKATKVAEWGLRTSSCYSNSNSFRGFGRIEEMNPHMGHKKDLKSVSLDRRSGEH